MTAQHKGRHVLHRDVEFLGQEVAEARAVEHTGHAADLFRRQARELLQRPDHRVERVGDADDKGVGRIVADTFADGLHDLEVDAQEVIAAHARLARDTGGDDADIGARDVGVVVGALELGVEFLRRARLGNIQGFALWGSFGDVKEDDVAEFFQRGEMRKRTADLSGADERDLGSGHGSLRSCLTIASWPSPGFAADARCPQPISGDVSGNIAVNRRIHSGSPSGKGATTV